MVVEIYAPNFSEIIFASAFALVILGHNLWLIGKNESKNVMVQANTGDNFPESDSAIKSERISNFQLISPDGFIPITDYRIEGHSLVADISTVIASPYCAALALYPHPITLEAKKFADYIKDEDAEEFVKSKFILENTNSPQRESYTKFAKVLLENHSTRTDDISNLVARHQLEIILLIAPSEIDSSRKLPVKVLFEGKPISGLRVSSGRENLNGGKYLAHTQTNENGLAQIEVNDAGRWFIRTHFIRLHSDTENFDWESFWASITFQVLK